MKSKIAAIISLPILLTYPIQHVWGVTIANKCTNQLRCSSYVYNTYVEHNSGGTADISHCINKEYNYCWQYSEGSTCLDNNSDYDEPGTCENVCNRTGYDVYVMDLNTYEWGCACVKDTSFVEWQKYSTRRERQYTAQYVPGTAGNGCITKSIATSNYRCGTGYYGTASSESACLPCPSNATCNHTSFYCNNGYYKNDSKTGCIKCPDSKEGGLGWDSNGNGIPADNGDELELCAISSGTVLHDTVGIFRIDYDAADGCEYSK